MHVLPLILLRQVLHALNAILKIYCELKNISANLIKYETVCTAFSVHEHTEFSTVKENH